MYYTVINQGKFRIVETATDGTHYGGWSKEVTVTENKPDAYLEASNRQSLHMLKYTKVPVKQEKLCRGLSMQCIKIRHVHRK